MDRLPFHLLSSVLRYALERDGSSCQVSLLTVNSTFYLAAIPTLYHSPHVQAKLDSFFSNPGFVAPEPRVGLSGTELVRAGLTRVAALVPETRDKLFNTELVRAGLTKIAALRYVRHLHITLPVAVTGDDDDGSIEGNAGLNTTQQDAMALELDRAGQDLAMIGVGALPRLRTICSGASQVPPCGESRSTVSARLAEASSKFSFWLFRSCSGGLASWCHHIGPPALFSPALIGKYVCEKSIGITQSSSVIEEVSQLPLPSLHIHTQLLDNFRILPHGRTYLHVHAPVSPDDDTIGRWIGRMVRMVSCLIDTAELRRAAIPKTQLVVSISFPAKAVPPQPADQTSDVPRPSADQTPDVQRTISILKYAKQWAIAGAPDSDDEEWKEMADLQLEARAWGDMPRRAGCEVKD